MSVDLDNRQLAMLREMGIRLWQAPSAEEAASDAAPGDSAAAAVPAAHAAPARAEAPVARARQVPSAAVTADEAEPQTGPAGPSWQLGSPQSVYPKATNPAPANTIRWLLVAELAPGATQPLEGEAGQLLDNMLRAAGMHLDAGLTFVAVQRGRGGEVASEDAGLAEQLALLVDAEQPSGVLVMGRLAAQALLPSPEPFAKRRGQALVFKGKPLLLMNDTTYLLRNLPEKAKAWEDLCLARAIAVPAPAQ